MKLIRIPGPTLVGAAIMALAVAIAAAVATVAQNERRLELQRVAERIERRIEAQKDLLVSLRAFVLANDLEIDPEALRRYLQLVAGETANGMQGLGLALFQPADDVAEAESFIAASQGQRRTIWPTTDQPHRFPIVFLQPPDDRNLMAIGFDMYSEPLRRAAIDRAWQTKAPAATEPVQLVQEATERVPQPGFLIYLPAFRDDGSIHSLIYAPYRLGDFMQDALNNPSSLGVLMRMWDGEAKGPPLLEPDQTAPGNPERFVIRVADRLWTMDLAGQLPTSAAKLRPMAILIVGGIMALMAQRLLTDRQRRFAAERAAAREAQRVAEMRGLLLDETKHRLKNAFARIASIARLTARQAPAPDEFLPAFERQLQALAAAQDLLTRAPDGAVDLGALFEAELASAGAPKHAVTAQGDPIALDPASAQAIGLVFHELLTNALKYGALSTGDGRLDVRWRASELATVDWSETGTAYGAGAGGFGSRLIDTLVTRQLRGKIFREVSTGGFTLRIEWPLT